MTNTEMLKQALDNELPIAALVQLANGAERVRVGIVAALNDTHVTFWDMGKGYRTAPLRLVKKVQAAMLEEETVSSLLQEMRNA